MNVSVFEEAPSAENASGFRSGTMSGLSSATCTPLEGGAPLVLSQSDSFRDPRHKLQRDDSQYSQDSCHSRSGNNSRVLVASRHLRNDSKTIQLEPRGRQHSLDEPPRPELVAARSHSRSNSRDLKYHSRSGSRDLSLDQLKHLALKSVENLDLTVLPMTKCVDEETKRLIEGTGVLRHRRTRSKDMMPPESKHKRTSSHHITMEPSLDGALKLHKGHSVDQLSTAFDPRI